MKKLIYLILLFITPYSLTSCIIGCGGDELPKFEVSFRIVNEKTLEPLVDTLGTYYHKDSIRVFNNPDLSPVNIQAYNSTSDFIIYTLPLEPDNHTWESFMEEYDGTYRDTFYLYLNQYDTDTIEVCYTVTESESICIQVLHNGTITPVDDYYLILKNKNEIR